LGFATVAACVAVAKLRPAVARKLILCVFVSFVCAARKRPIFPSKNALVALFAPRRASPARHDTAPAATETGVPPLRRSQIVVPSNHTCTQCLVAVAAATYAVVFGAPSS